jgi:hypothetical protein
MGVVRQGVPALEPLNGERRIACISITITGSAGFLTVIVTGYLMAIVTAQKSDGIFISFRNF